MRDRSWWTAAGLTVACALLFVVLGTLIVREYRSGEAQPPCTDVVEFPLGDDRTILREYEVECPPEYP